MEQPFLPTQQTLYYVGWRSFHHKGYLVAYHRETDIVGVTKYETCSCNDTAELFAQETWESVNWEYRGSTEAFYAICQGHLDVKLPSRKVHEEDYNAKWILKLQDVFVEWYEAGKPRWEDEKTKREENAIRGGVNDHLSALEGGRAGDMDADSFQRDTAIRDADKAAARRWIDQMGGEGSNVSLRVVNPDGTQTEMDVILSAGREFEYI